MVGLREGGGSGDGSGGGGEREQKASNSWLQKHKERVCYVVDVIHAVVFPLQSPVTTPHNDFVYINLLIFALLLLPPAP